MEEIPNNPADPASVRSALHSIFHQQKPGTTHPWKAVFPEKWNDWKWQLSHRIFAIEKLKAVIHLTKNEEEAIRLCWCKFPMAITPYFSSLLDPFNSRCPLRLQCIPRKKELVVGKNDMIDPCGEDLDAVVPNLVHPHNLSETWEKVQNGSLFFRTFLDRASDNVEAIRSLVWHLKARGTPLINHPDLLPRANDKATMHLELLAKGVDVPYTIIMGAQEGDDIQNVPELQHIGTPFIIKPANGGGGRGVIIGAQDKVDVVQARKTLWGDKMLLQEEIQPAQLPAGMAWFRTFLVGQSIHLCWWNKDTHGYRPVIPVEEAEFGLETLRMITRKIEEVCGLTLFSTEIAQSNDGRAVDYVNDQPDLRPQSKARDGVPDHVLNGIVKNIVHWSEQCIQADGTQDSCLPSPQEQKNPDSE